MSAIERWLPVIGCESSYEVSNQGRVRSVDRVIVASNGQRRRMKGVTLKPGRVRNHLHVSIGGGNSRRLHHLVLEAFVGPRPEGAEGLHLDDNPDNNRSNNLYWGTRSQNEFDKVRNGRHHQANKSRCKRQHEFTSQNTYVIPSTGSRQCLTCKRQLAAAKRAA